MRFWREKRLGVVSDLKRYELAAFALMLASVDA